MAHVAPIYPNFARGEVSPLMFGRIDIEQYPTCLDKCRNTYIRPYGCATRLSGTEFIANAKNNGKARLLKFVFSATDSYIIECGAGYFRFYQDGAPVLNGNNVIYEISNTYSEEQLKSIQYVQLDDIIKLVCLPDSRGNSSAKPKELIRRASNDWVFRDVEFKETPYLDQNTTDITMTPSAVTGNSITITASSNYFNANMVGANFWIGTKVTDSATNKDVQGFVKITAVTDATHATASVQSKLSGTSATKLWGEGAFSNYRGYPSCIALYDGRLWYGRTPTQPRNLYGSLPYAYETFTPAVDNEDDAGINIQLATNANGDGSDIKWIIGASYLLCGTYGGEFVIRGTGDGAITATDISARQRTNWGGEPVQPIVAGTFVHFLQRNGNKLRQFQYDFYYDSYKAVDVSIFSEHLLSSPIKEMALQKNPDSIIYLMREDGKVVMLTLEQDQSVQAWSLLEEMGASVESIQTIPSYDGNFDEVYMLMSRRTLSTTLNVISSNPNVTATTSYSGIRPEGTYTEILECTTASHYTINNHKLTPYSETTFDTETGISTGSYTVYGQPSNFGYIYITTDDDIQTEQTILLFEYNNRFTTKVKIRNNYFYANSVQLAEVEADTSYVVRFFNAPYEPPYTRLRIYKIVGDTEAFIAESNLPFGVYHIKILGGERITDYNFKGVINLGKSSIIEKLAIKTQVLTSETTGEVVNLSNPEYSITLSGDLEVGDTLTLIYQSTYSASSRYIERMLNPITAQNQNDWWYVRSGLKYDGYSLTEGKVLTLSANSGTVTATSSSAIFSPSMVGNRIRYVDSNYNILGEGKIKAYSSNTSVTLDITSPFQSVSLDGGHWGISTDTLSGLNHLEGMEVQVYADCIEQENKKVVSGSIEIEDAFIAVAGLPYTSYITTMPMEAGSQNGTAVGKRKRISEMAIRVWNTIGVKVGRDLDNLYDTIYKQKEPFTGVIPNIKYNQGWVWDANITVEQSHPYPMNILSIAPIVTEVDK